jgi:hypothetical protein
MGKNHVKGTGRINGKTENLIAFECAFENIPDGYDGEKRGPADPKRVIIRFEKGNRPRKNVGFT